MHQLQQMLKIERKLLKGDMKSQSFHYSETVLLLLKNILFFFQFPLHRCLFYNILCGETLRKKHFPKLLLGEKNV